MKKAAFYLLGFIVFMLMMPLALFMLPAQAKDASACYSISDADGRSYCLARASSDASKCYSIQRGDLRSACLAEVRK